MNDVRLIRGKLGTVGHHDGRSCVRMKKGDRGATLYGRAMKIATTIFVQRSPFFLGLDDNVLQLGDAVCAKLEILADNGSRLLAERRLLHSDLTDGLSEFVISLSISEAKKLEYRVQTTGQVALWMADHVCVGTSPAIRPRPFPKGCHERNWENERELLDGYLRNISGLIHVGANYGQERRY